MKLPNSPNSIYSSWLPLSTQDRALPGECWGRMVLSEPFESHAEISACFIPPGAPASGPLGSEEAEPPSQDGHPGRLPHPFSRSGWHQATSHANVRGFSHRSPGVLARAALCLSVRSPCTRPSPFPGSQALLLASCLPCRIVAPMDPETEAHRCIWFTPTEGNSTGGGTGKRD